ncbi:MAG: PQQ-binding-like beta-propeller repeat protein [Planctomycetota bacterium]
MMQFRRPVLSFLSFSVVLLVGSGVMKTHADDADWSQWRGPARDGHAAPQKLLQSWPPEGPKLLWSVNDLGTGYSAVTEADGKLYTMGSIDDQAMVICMSAKDGTRLWATAIGPAGKKGDYNTGWGAGQRGTPTIDGDQVFVLSDLGMAAAVDRNSGELRWAVDLIKTEGGAVPTWGYSESPLVDGDRVMVTPGGESFLVGLDRRTGEKIWAAKGVNAPAQYVSVMKGTLGGRAFYVTASKPGMYLFDVETGDGQLLDTATANGIAVIPTPILEKDYVYHTSAYGAGNTLLKLSGTPLDVNLDSVYALNSKSMENHHGGVVLVDGVIYGFTKAGGGAWMAQDFLTGETLWQERARPNKSGSICYADGRLYCYNDKDGTVLLVVPSRTGYEQVGKLKLPAETEIPRDSGAIWAHPVVSNGRLLIRDQDLLYAFDVSG